MEGQGLEWNWSESFSHKSEEYKGASISKSPTQISTVVRNARLLWKMEHLKKRVTKVVENVVQVTVVSALGMFGTTTTIDNTPMNASWSWNTYLQHFYVRILQMKLPKNQFQIKHQMTGSRGPCPKKYLRNYMPLYSILGSLGSPWSRIQAASRLDQHWSLVQYILIDADIPRIKRLS